MPFPFCETGAAEAVLFVRVLVDYSATPHDGIRVVRYRTPDGRTVDPRAVLAGQGEVIHEAIRRDLRKRRKEIDKGGLR